jgi:hypothetical protein
MDDHLEEESKKFNNEVDRMQFEKKNLEFMHFHNVFASCFHFHFIFKNNFIFLITKLSKPFLKIINTKSYEN